MRADTAKTMVTLFAVVAILGTGKWLTEILDNPYWCIASSIPMFFVAITSMYFQWPGYMVSWFMRIAEQDASRGALSLKNLGALVMIVAPVGAYLLNIV